MSSREILFIQTAFIGDLLLSIPTLRAIKKENSDSTLTLLCRKGLADFMRNAQVADEIIEADKSSSEHWSAVTRKLSTKVWDKIYCPHESPRSMMLAKKLRSPNKIGYRSLIGKLIFDQAVERPMHLPEALRQLVLVEFYRKPEVLNYDDKSNQNIYRRFPKAHDQKDLTIFEKMKPVPDFASMLLPELVSAHREEIVVLAPGSVWPTKMWRADGFSEVAAHFIQSGKQVYLVGAASEKAICQKVKELAETNAPSAAEKIINSAGELSLWQSAQLMGRAQLVVANDSGAMHMAACAGTPSVTVFGPTVLEQGYRPWQNNSVVLHRVLSCRPCGKHGSQRCPIGTHECMKLVSSESVLSASNKLSSLL